MHDAALVAWRGFGSSGTSTGSTRGSGGTSSTAAGTGCAPAAAGRSSVRCRCSGTSTPARARRVGSGPVTAVADPGPAGPGDRDPRSRDVVVIALRFAATCRSRRSPPGSGSPRSRSSRGSITRCDDCGPRRARRGRAGDDRRRPRDPPPRAFRRSSARSRPGTGCGTGWRLSRRKWRRRRSGAGVGWRGPPSRRSRPWGSGILVVRFALVDRSLGPVIVYAVPIHRPRHRRSCPATGSRRRR